MRPTPPLKRAFLCLFLSSPNSSFTKMFSLFVSQFKRHQTLRSFQPFSRLLFSTICILLSLVVGISQGAGLVPNDNTPLDKSLITSGFVGAELYTNYNANGKTSIFLKRYFHCSNDVLPQKEIVVLHERQTKMVFSVLTLQKIDSPKVEKKSSKLCNAFEDEKMCITSVTYVAEVLLSIMPSGYDAVWKIKSSAQSSSGLNPDNVDGISLSIHIPDPYRKLSNQSEGLANVNELIFCNEQEYSMDLRNPTDKNSNISYNLIQVGSLNQLKNNDLDMPGPAIPIMDAEDNGLVDTKIDRDILLQFPPFEPFTGQMSMENIPYVIDNTGFQIENSSGVLNFNPKSTGKHLIGISKINNTKKSGLNYHQAAFVFEVK